MYRRTSQVEDGDVHIQLLPSPASRRWSNNGPQSSRTSLNSRTLTPSPYRNTAGKSRWCSYITKLLLGLVFFGFAVTFFRSTVRTDTTSKNPNIIEKEPASISIKRPTLPDTLVWKSIPFEGGHIRKQLDIPVEFLAQENITSTHSVLHSVIVDEKERQKEDESETIIRVIFAAWDRPLVNKDHMICSKHFEDGQYRRKFKLLLKPDGPDSPKILEGREKLFLHYETSFGFSNSELGLHTSQPDREIPGELQVYLGDTLVGSYDFTLKQQALPAARMAICLKPFFGKGQFDYPRMVEWREHHAMLGFDVVHWASRDEDFSAQVARLNAATGGRDTFRWKPDFEEQAESHYWDETQMFDECYAMHRQTADWIGVWDMDEFFAPLPEYPWTRDWLEKWLAEQDPELGNLAMPMTWVDRFRFGAVPSERFLALDPTVTEQDLARIDNLRQNANGVHTWHHIVYHKSLHRTALQYSADIHYGWPGLPVQTDPLAVVIYHARPDQYIPREDYIDYPLNLNIINFWKELGKRVEAVLNVPASQ